MPTEEIIGLVAGIFTASSLLPQVIKTIREKKADEVSIGMLLALLTGISLWIVYGWLKKDMPILLTNSFSQLLNFVMIFLRIKYGKAKSKGEAATE